MLLDNSENTSENDNRYTAEMQPENETALIADAQSLSALISGAQSSDTVKKLQGQLAGLMSLAKGSTAVMSEIFKGISSADGVISKLELSEREAMYTRIMESRYLDDDTKKLYQGIEKYMSDEERMFLNEIDPARTYTVAVFDKYGNIIGEKAVTGAEIQESFILLKAQQNKGRLTKEQREALNMKLHGTKEDAQTPEEHEEEKRVLWGAIGNVQGYALFRNPEQVNIVKSVVQSSRSALDAWDFSPPSEKTITANGTIVEAMPNPAEQAVNDEINAVLASAAKSNAKETAPKVAPATPPAPAIPALPVDDKTLLVGFRASQEQPKPPLPEKTTQTPPVTSVSPAPLPAAPRLPEGTTTIKTSPPATQPLKPTDVSMDDLIDLIDTTFAKVSGATPKIPKEIKDAVSALPKAPTSPAAPAPTVDAPPAAPAQPAAPSLLQNVMASGTETTAPAGSNVPATLRGNSPQR